MWRLYSESPYMKLVGLRIRPLLAAVRNGGLLITDDEDHEEAGRRLRFRLLLELGVCRARRLFALRDVGVPARVPRLALDVLRPARRTFAHDLAVLADRQEVARAIAEQDHRIPALDSEELDHVVVTRDVTSAFITLHPCLLGRRACVSKPSSTISYLLPYVNTSLGRFNLQTPDLRRLKGLWTQMGQRFNSETRLRSGLTEKPLS